MSILPVSTVSIVQPLEQVGRKMRSPKHSFGVRHRPYQIQPFVIAPVLPGDTLKSIDLKATAVTAGVKSPLLGWWLEHQFYFVPFSALEGREGSMNGFDPPFLMDPSGPTGLGVLRGMLLDPVADLAGAVEGVSETGGRADHTGVDWVTMCLNCVTAWWFRDEAEVEPTPIGALPIARLKPPGQDGFWQSFKRDADVEAVDVIDPLTGEIGPSDDPYYTAFLNMQGLGLTGDVTYEDWLRDQGIRIPKTKATVNEGGVSVPELLRSSRSFKKPSNTPDATGNLSSVVLWDVSEDATKERFFKEPGFVIGVTVARPKVYLGGLNGPAVNSLMTTAFSWLPKALTEKPELALRKFASGEGPVTAPTDTEAYWLDVADLFVYGDQFLANPDGDATFAAYQNVVASPGTTEADWADAVRLYPTAAMADALFSGTAKHISQDGQVLFRFLSRLRDLT